MAIGKIYEMSTSFADYSYIINGVGGIGKTELAHQLGKIATKNNKGTLILTIGCENIPEHHNGVFGDVASDFSTLIRYAKELAKDRNTTYKDTQFICFDSLDELFRITENYVINEYNVSISNDKDKKTAKSIASAYGGFQHGENRVVDWVLKIYDILRKAGYRMIFIGHTKVKNVTDPLTGVVYETLTCNLDNKYYNAIKDKVNLVATCYNEKEIADIKQEKNAFTKKMQNKGKLVSAKRVIIFRDDDNAIDMKSHFPHIVNKIDFSAEGFIKAVEDALIKKKNGDNVEIQPYFRPETNTEKVEETIDDTGFDEIDDTIESFEDIDTVTETVEEKVTETNESHAEPETKVEVDTMAMSKEIVEKIKTANKDVKIKVKEILTAKNEKLPTENVEVLNEILALF